MYKELLKQEINPGDLITYPCYSHYLEILVVSSKLIKTNNDMGSWEGADIVGYKILRDRIKERELGHLVFKKRKHTITQKMVSVLQPDKYFTSTDIPEEEKLFVRDLIEKIRNGQA
jgi:hypothetical protein